MRNANRQRAELAALLWAALALSGCFRVSRHTTDLRLLEHSAMERCARLRTACAAAARCASGTLKAARAWVDVGVRKQADAEAMADGLRPDRALRLAKETAALRLDEDARLGCAPDGGTEAR